MATNATFDMPPHSLAESPVKLFVIEIFPSSQLSSADAFAIQLMIIASLFGSPHSKVISGGQVIVGRELSTIFISAVHEAVFPQASVAVKVTV